MDRLKQAITIGGGIVIAVLIMLAIAEITGWLPHSDDKYYIALTGVATLILAVGTLGFMWSQNSASRRVAGFQMMIQLDAQYNGEQLRAARNELAPLLIGRNNVLAKPAEEILDFFEMLACYTRAGHLDLMLVSNGFSLPVRCYWESLKNYVHEMRNSYGDSSLYEHVEWLNGKLVGAYAREGNIDLLRATLTRERVDQFLRSETTTVVPLCGKNV